MAQDLVTIDNIPQLPTDWNYNDSIQKSKQHIYKWSKLTVELATELWIAREVLSLPVAEQPRTAVGTFVPTDKSWGSYCEELGNSRQVVNRWLQRFFPDSDKNEPPEAPIVEDIPSNITLLEGDIFDNLIHIENESTDLLLTDPPYGVMNDYDWDAPDLSFLDGWIKAVIPKLKPKYSAFIFCDARRQYHFEGIIRNNDLQIKNRIIWIRKNMSKGRVITDHFISSYEVIFFLGNKDLNLPSIWGGERFDSCEFAVPQSNFTDKKMHPTQKPLALIKHLTSVGSFPGDTILDCFAGSGTTGIACLTLGHRNCIMIENNPSYINTIKGRINALGRRQTIG